MKNRANNFGFLRLLFAILVIVSHSPELIDGNRSREVLTRLFGTMSFGELAVDGFFIISGYLITKSFIASKTLTSYFAKRVLRIYPGYLVNFWLCVLILAPFVGGHNPLSIGWLKQNILRNTLLLEPASPGAFVTLHDPLLNGSVWTISYEFRCYLLAAVLGLVGCYRPRGRIPLLLLCGAFIGANFFHVLDGMSFKGEWALGALGSSARFAAAFTVGQLFYLFGDRIRFTHRGALTATIVLVPLMFSARFAETALICFGGYLIFWFAFRVPMLSLSKADNKADISYGVYLYAWPIQSLLIWCFPSIRPWALCIASLGCSSVLGMISWVLIEKPSMTFGPFLMRRARIDASAAHKNM